MATRRTPIRQWEIDRSQANKLIKRLMRHIMYTGPVMVPDPNDKTPDPRLIPAKQFMSDSQVRACLGVLKKYMPDLKSIEHTGDPDHPVVHRIERVIVDPDPANSPSIPAPTDPEPL